MYVPSIREIPLNEDPHKSVLDSLLPSLDEDESPGTGEIDFDNATEDEISHLQQCRTCATLTGYDKASLLGDASEQEVG